MRRALAATVSILAVATVVAAPAGAQTRARWADQADAICAREFAKVHAVVNDASRNPPRTVAEWSRWFNRMITPVIRVHHDIGALEAPANDRTAIKDLLGNLGRSIAEMKAARDATVARNLAGYKQHLKRALSAGKRSDAIFARLGADVCANG